MPLLRPSACLAALLALAACRGPAVRTSTGPDPDGRLLAAYRSAATCVDSVSAPTAFGPAPIASATLRRGKWGFLLRRSAPREGGEGHVIWLEYAMAPGRDSLQLEVAAVASYEHPGAEVRQARGRRPQRTARLLPEPAPAARDAAERLQALCSVLPIYPRRLPVAPARVGE